MLFHPRYYGQRIHFELSMAEESLEKVYSFNYLGYVLNPRLDFIDKIQQAVMNTKQSFERLWRVKKFISK